MRVIDSAQCATTRTSPHITRAIEGIKGDYLEDVVRALSFPRHYLAERANNRRAAAWVADAFRSLGYRVSLEGSCDNIVATHPECSPGPKLLVGTHYDTVPGTAGADDNASAVAVALACAKMLSRIASTAPVVFVSFNREEEDLLGSRAFVEEHIRRGQLAIGVAHILEMVGYCSKKPGSQHLPASLPIAAPDTGDFLALLANRRSNRYVPPLLTLSKTYLGNFRVLGLQLCLGIEKFFPHLRRGDHAPFWRAGIPALMWTDTAEFRNPNYHRASDTPDTLDYQFMKRVAQLLLAMILSYQGSSKSPVSRG